MKKIFVILLIFPCLCFSQSDIFFYTDENGLIYLTDSFYDYYNIEEEITEEQKTMMVKALETHKNYFYSDDTILLNKINSYKQILDMSSFLNKETLEYSEKLYSYISDDVSYRYYIFAVIYDLVSTYNEIGKYHLALSILEKHKKVIEKHKNFTCGNGAKIHYNKVGSLFFETYRNLNYTDETLIYGFKYLLNNKKFSKELVEVLAENYSKEDLLKTFSQLEGSFVENNNKSLSNFQYLNYKIDVDGFSGIFWYYNKSKGLTEFDQLKNIWFYKNLEAYLNK